MSLEDGARLPEPAPGAAAPLLRVRVSFAKGEALRWTGHLDLNRAWERLARRSRLPVAYSQGFHPTARIQLASALPLGFTSDCELADLWLDAALPIPEVEAALRRAAPPGIEIQRVAAVELSQPALQTRVVSAEYAALLLESPPTFDLAAQVDRLLAAESLPRERRGKPYDLRPLIEGLRALPPGATGLPRLWLRLAAREGATGRPEEVLAAAGLDPTAARVMRTALHFRPAGEPGAKAA